MKNEILDEKLIERDGRPFSVPLTIILSVVVGLTIGVVTNAVHVHVSPVYFKIVMGWEEISTEYLSFLALFQGIKEGAIYGLIFSVALVAAVGWKSTNMPPRSVVNGVLLKAVGIIFVCWLLGGGLGVLVFMVLPEIDPTEPFFTSETNQGLRFGFVGGGIWGCMIGAVIALIWAVVKLRKA